MRCLTSCMRPALILAAVGLAGCAATVQRTTPDAGTLKIPPESSRNIVMNLTGSSVATRSSDWEPFKGEWRGAMSTAAATRGAKFSTQDGSPRPTAEPGTLVVIDVQDYRYLTPTARLGFGIMTGNAYIDTRVRFLDSRTGAPFGERSYNTSSTAWQGIFSAVTDKQIQAICNEILNEIDPR